MNLKRPQNFSTLTHLPRFPFCSKVVAIMWIISLSSFWDSLRSSSFSNARASQIFQNRVFLNCLTLIIFFKTIRVQAPRSQLEEAPPLGWFVPTLQHNKLTVEDLWQSYSSVYYIMNFLVIWAVVAVTAAVAGEMPAVSTDQPFPIKFFSTVNYKTKRLRLTLLASRYFWEITKISSGGLSI